MNCKLSVIIPVYNGEKFVVPCLLSLVNQLRDEVEIVVINDGSTDSTEQRITTQFQQWIDSRQLVYLPTQNAGVSAARNLGLDTAKGEYVAFVDADDLVSADYFATIFEAIKAAPDIIEFGYRNIDLDDRPLNQGRCAHKKLGFHPASEMLDHVFGSCLWYPVLRVVKASLFEGIRFPLGVRFCEDLMTLSAVYKRAGTIYALSAILYDYRINPAGATLNTRPDYAAKLIDFYRTISHDRSFANKALKINLAFAIRGCIAKTTDPLGRMPEDIEVDVRGLMWTPRLLFFVRTQFVMYAIWGRLLYFIKKHLK